MYDIEWRDKLIFPKFSIFKNGVFFDLGTDILKSHFLCCQIWRSYHNFRDCSTISYLSYAENRMKNLFSNKSYSLWTFGRFALQMRPFFEKFLPNPMTFDWDEVFCFCFFYLNLVTLLFVQTKYKQNFKPEMEKKRPLKNFVQRNQMCWNWAYLVVIIMSLSLKIFHIKLETPKDPNLKIWA